MELDRRSFIKGGVALGGAAALAGLAGCASPAQSTPENGGTEQRPEAAQDYKAKPEPISDDQITETLEADIVVVGAGNAGAVAAATASEEGASVIVLQKIESVYSHGFVFTAIGSKMQKDMGYDVNGWEIVGDMNRETGCNLGKWEVLGNWVNYSGNLADWIVERFGETKYGPFIIEEPVAPSEHWNRSYQTTFIPVGEMIGTGTMMTLATELVNDAVERGNTEVRYNTPAVQLRQDESGRVTGVIGQTEAGEYILCNAKKGVILAAGGYECNPEMRAEYLQQADGLDSAYTRPDVTTGDGILMGMWAGGQIQRSPHCSNIHYDPSLRFHTLQGTTIPFLRVNAEGMRFSNEDVSYDEVWAQDVRQPDQMHFQIFDDNYMEDLPNMGTGMTQYGDWTTIVPDGVENGWVYKADTIEDLAEQMGVPADAFAATVKRYNELAEGDYDYEPDFGKLGYKVKPIAKAPFYAIPRHASVLTTLSGLEVNADMQVLGEDGKPIEGLYAAGNNSGNFFGGVYQKMSTPGMSVGRAFLTGRVAAWRACGITD
ncbi:FAD-dependent oxidoreductase [Raoultibacter timonensis]|uniref:FAD-dependent oxidoreductase n=1 Tax=Raoultibacter timonensis TaxID=1907662 RepID=UPI000C82BACF|nr:FAD-binding protein [Raoultibacter timonensis]